MHIFFLCDSHLTASTPEHPSPRKHRRVTFEQDILDKLSWVADLASKEDEAAIAHGGDGFDRPIEPMATSLRYADWWRRVDAFTQGHSLHVVGQHECRAYLVDSVRGCSLGILMRLGSALEDWHRWEDRKGHTWQIRSLHCNSEHLLAMRNPVEVQAADIVATHISIGYGYGCTRPEDIHWPGVKVALCSHIHTGFPICEYNGTVFVAPGALARLNADEIHRQPQIAHIEVEAGKVLSVEYIPVPCKPAEEVFDMGGLEQDAEAQQERVEFRETIAQIEAARASGGGVVEDWREALEKMRGEVGDEVVARLIGYCEGT